jgi:hypothetical protein
MGATEKVRTSNQLFVDYDTKKVFVWNNRYDQGLFDEPDGSGEFTLSEGQVIGRIASSGKLKICASDATDGSQIPIGVVKGSYTMAESATNQNITYCISGDVDQSSLLFSGSEDLDTTVTIVNDPDGTPSDTSNVRTMRDLIQSVGIRLVAADELENFDNS